LSSIDPITTTSTSAGDGERRRVREKEGERELENEHERSCSLEEGEREGRSGKVSSERGQLSPHDEVREHCNWPDTIITTLEHARARALLPQPQEIVDEFLQLF